MSAKRKYQQNATVAKMQMAPKCQSRSTKSNEDLKKKKINTVNKIVLEWWGSLIPRKFLDKHNDRSVCCGHIVGIRAPKVVLTSVSTPLGTHSGLMTRVHIINWSIWEEYFQNSWFLIWCTMGNLQWNKDINQFWWFPEDLKEVQDLKVKSIGKINEIRCSFYSQGFCKAGPCCIFDHPEVDCDTHIGKKYCRGWKWYKQHTLPLV